METVKVFLSNSSVDLAGYKTRDVSGSQELGAEWDRDAKSWFIPPEIQIESSRNGQPTLLLRLILITKGCGNDCHTLFQKLMADAKTQV